MTDPAQLIRALLLEAGECGGPAKAFAATQVSHAKPEVHNKPL